MGTSHIELVQRVPEGFDVPAPRKIYEGRYWGDPGFIHLCFDIRNMEAIRECAGSLGHSFVCDGGRDFKMGEADGHFTYVEDPDGTLIEFVETFKVPVLKKLGIYLHLEHRDPAQAAAALHDQGSALPQDQVAAGQDSSRTAIRIVRMISATASMNRNEIHIRRDLTVHLIQPVPLYTLCDDRVV